MSYDTVIYRYNKFQHRGEVITVIADDWKDKIQAYESSFNEDSEWIGDNDEPSLNEAIGAVWGDSDDCEAVGFSPEQAELIREFLCLD